MTIKLVLEGPNEIHDGRFVARHFPGRHLTGSQLADHLLRNNGVQVWILGIEILQIQSSLQCVLVVAGNADLLDQSVVIHSERWRCSADHDRQHRRYFKYASLQQHAPFPENDPSKNP